MSRTEAAVANRRKPAVPKRVSDLVAEADRAQQRARLFSRARLFIATKFLGNADPTIEFAAVASVLDELLVAAGRESQYAQRLLGQPVPRVSGTARGRRHVV